MQCRLATGVTQKMDDVVQAVNQRNVSWYARVTVHVILMDCANLSAARRLPQVAITRWSVGRAS
jgi:hypothetical protein